MKYFIEIDSLTKAKDKIKIYKHEEDISFSEINKNYKNINYNYNTGNTNRIIELENELINKFKIISRIHNDNIFVIDKNIYNYIKTAKDVTNTFGDINVGGINND